MLLAKPLRFSLICLLSSLTILSQGCQSSPLTEFGRLSIGDDKATVLEALGGPQSTKRRQGIDRWGYVLYQDGIKHLKQLDFYDGILIYKGDPVPPFISAEEQDRLNQKKNRLR